MIFVTYSGPYEVLVTTAAEERVFVSEIFADPDRNIRHYVRKEIVGGIAITTGNPRLEVGEIK
jgi:hypothetical protein